MGRGRKPSPPRCGPTDLGNQKPIELLLLVVVTREEFSMTLVPMGTLMGPLIPVPAPVSFVPGKVSFVVTSATLPSGWVVGVMIVSVSP